MRFHSSAPAHARRLIMTAAATLFAMIAGANATRAETIRIVAIGASNTSGYAVGQSNAYPAILERLLRAKGYDVTVVNAGVTAETSAGTLSRVNSAVTPGTKIVIY